jgi:hypothetical protein
MKIKATELFILQCIIYVIFWMTNDYIATLLSTIFFFIFLSIYIIAFIAEKLDHSNVPNQYFSLMATGFLSPLVMYIIFYFLNGGKFNWMSN